MFFAESRFAHTHRKLFGHVPPEAALDAYACNTTRLEDNSARASTEKCLDVHCRIVLLLLPSRLAQSSCELYGKYTTEERLDLHSSLFARGMQSGLLVLAELLQLSYSQ